MRFRVKGNVRDVRGKTKEKTIKGLKQSKGSKQGFKTKIKTKPRVRVGFRVRIRVRARG